MTKKQTATFKVVILFFFLFFGNVFLLPDKVNGEEIFVSPTGSDTWSGRLAYANAAKADGPKATLSAALEAARKVAPGQPRRIVLKAGEYFLEKPLVLDSRDNNLEIVAVEGERVIHIQGTRNKPVKDITLKGFQVSVTTTPLQAGGFGAAKFAGAIQVDTAQNCRLYDLEIFNVGGQGIKVNGGRTEITHCQVHHSGACGIKAPSCVVTDNHVHDIGLTYPSSIALLGGGSNGVFSHNEIHDAPYTGINCGGANHKIEANHIYRVMQKLHDGGGIYCFAGKNTVLRGNFIHDVIDTGGYGSSAYYLDERSEQCIVEKNLSVNVARPSHNHMAHHNTIRNNVFIHDGDMRLTFPKCSDFTFQKNVLYATGKITINGTNVLTDFKQNILYSKKGEVIGQTINNYSTTGSKPLKPDKNNSFADPGLLEYQTGRVKFRPDSPILKSGIMEIDVRNAGPRKIK